MLAPVPLAGQSASDSITHGSFSTSLIPSIHMDADAWRPLPSSSSSELLSQQATTTTSSAQYRARSAPRARPSNLARSSFSHNQGRRCHHHRNRPSKQFVATTSGDIFGDWDIELKIDHRTLAKTTGTAAAIRGVNLESKATSAAGRRGGGGGSGIERGSITVGAGPGVNTGSSGMAPPSIPLATAPISSSSSTTATTASPVLRIMKGELPSTSASIPSTSKASPSTKTPKNNTSTTTPAAATMTATATPSTNINYNSSSSPPWKKNASKKSSDNNKNAVTSAPTTTIATIPSTSTSVVSAAAAAAAKKSWNKKDGDEIIDSAVPAPSARSSFLKALGKFKTKHLHQKRSSAPPTTPLAVIEPSPHSVSLEDRRASYVLPIMHFDEPEPQHQQQDQQQDQQQLSRALSPVNSTTSEQAAASFSVPVIELSSDLSPGVGPSLVDGAVADGNSSLRVKFKNKLASMKSSSNLRDKAKAQSAANSLAEPTSLSSTNSERRQSAYVISPTDLSQQDANAGTGKSNRQSKAFWTFPRVRHESNQQASKQVPWMGDANTTATVTDSHRQLNAAADATMQATEHGPTATDEPLTLSQQLQALKVEETQDQQQQLTFDSDHSLDIIQPVDYEDYTQFAELPLKKRKKMERSLAAAAASAANAKSGGRKPNSMRAGAGAMKRLLTKQQQQEVGDVAQDREIYTINGNKKRPQIPAEMTEGVSKQTGQHSEWRRSLLKSLHLGKGEQSSRKAAKARESNPGRALSPTPLGAIAESSTERQQQPSTAGPSHTHSSRHMRSGSVQSTRSLSLATSTHPALLATTIPKPRTPGLRRETLEMAMRRRRQSSVARSNISDTDIPPPLPLSSGFFGVENISTTNITHTFTSFTLELAELYAQDVVNNSAVPGLFNFKQQPPQPRASRMTVSSHTMMDMDTDQEFRGFDSDGDAISGYTGDADVSMEEIQVGSHTPKSPSSPTSATMLSATSQHLEVREPGMAAPSPSRRKISSVDGESDTVPELPTLMIRTRDLNNRNNYSRSGRPLSGSSFEIENDQSPRSPRRSHGGSISPTMSRKGGRGMMASPTSPSGSRQAGSMSSPTRSSRPPLSMEDIVSWKPRNTSQSSSRPQVPALVTKPLRPAKSSGISYSPILTQSPGMVSPTERGSFNRFHHYQQSTSSSSSSQYPHHQHQTSADTLVSTHPRYGSNISAGSGYSAQTLTGGVGGDYHQRLHQQYSSGGGAPLGAREFDPREEFPPTTPADLKAMDFEALLLTAEMEQQKGWEDLMAQKRSSALDTTLATSSIVAPSPSKGMANFPAMSMPPSGAFQRQPSVQPLKINTSAASKNNRSGQQQQQQIHQRNAVAFDLGPSDDGGTGTNTGTGTGSDRSLRSKRVMKKKMSVIRLAGSGNGNVQGRRENDGLIRVSVSPTPYASAPTPTPPSDFGTAGW